MTCSTHIFFYHICAERKLFSKSKCQWFSIKTNTINPLIYFANFIRSERSGPRGNNKGRFFPSLENCLARKILECEHQLQTKQLGDYVLATRAILLVLHSRRTLRLYLYQVLPKVTHLYKALQIREGVLGTLRDANSGYLKNCI